MPNVLLVDNYDSFTWNLVQAFEVLGARVDVVRNDADDVAGLVGRRPTHLVVSPGPGDPEQAGVSMDAIRAFLPTTPVLGVCLGHQALAAVLGGRVRRAGRVVHGKPSAVRHDGTGLFAGLPSPFDAGRYHSLAVDDLPEDLVACAWSDDGEVMAIRHRTRPAYGVQFHPESVLTPEGPKLLAAFLRT